jgi:excisionase family DNA binding protein
MGTQRAPVERYMTPRDAAGRLLISERSVRNAIARGELRAVKVCRRVRIAEQDFDAWVAGARIEPDRPLELPARTDSPGTGLRGLLAELGS